MRELCLTCTDLTLRLFLKQKPIFAVQEPMETGSTPSVEDLALRGREFLYTRRTALKALEAHYNAHLVPSFKKVRIDYCPHDKKGEMVDLVVYVFDALGSYGMRFPKSVRIPLKMETQEALDEVVVVCVQKMMLTCGDLMHPNS